MCSLCVYISSHWTYQKIIASQSLNMFFLCIQNQHKETLDEVVLVSSPIPNLNEIINKHIFKNKHYRWFRNSSSQTIHLFTLIGPKQQGHGISYNLNTLVYSTYQTLECSNDWRLLKGMVAFSVCARETLHVKAF